MSVMPPHSDATWAKLAELRVPLEEARSLAVDRSRAVVVDLDRTGALGRDIARLLAFADALARALYVAGALDDGSHRADAFARDLARAVARDLARAYNPDRAHELARDLDHALTHGLAAASDLTAFRTQFRRDIQILAELLTDTRELTMGCKAAVLAETKDVWLSRERPYMAVSRSAARVAAWSVWVLPPADRARYDEEFRSELRDLAASGAAGRAQLWHAVRLLIWAWLLRIEIKKSRSERAVS